MDTKQTVRNNFTLIRLILATLVVFGHYRTLRGVDVTPFGISYYADVAVDAFFVVSGYLITLSYAARPNLVDFYVKRLFRIYPLYATMILVQATIMIVLLGGLAHHLAGLAKYLATNLIFANFLAHDIDGLFAGIHNHGINPSLWTIKIEVMFYALLPPIWILSRRFGAWVLVALYVASTIFAEYALMTGHADLAKQFPGQLRYFVVGIALYRYADRIRIGRGAACLCAIVLFGLCSLIYMLPLVTVYPLMIGMLVFLCALRVPVLLLKRDISYGVYLIHGPIIQLSLLMGIFRDGPIYLTAMLCAVFGLALLAEIFIERPGIALGRMLLGLRPNRATGLPEPYADPVSDHRPVA
jgi:peptidoglycan/LPS O-acetylase OafA/YrhL